MHRAWMVVAATAAVLPVDLAAQQWSYLSYMEGESKPWGTAGFQLREPSPGRYRARYMLPGGSYTDECFRPEVNATVVVQQDEQIVTLEPAFRGCPTARMILKTDGSGGRRELLQPDGSWQWDGRERAFKRK